MFGVPRSMFDVQNNQPTHIMSESIGLVETKGLTGSIEASDAMAKAASVSLVKQISIGGGFLTVLV